MAPEEIGSVERGSIVGIGEAARCLGTTKDRLKEIARGDLSYTWTPAGQRRYWSPDIERYATSHGIDFTPIDPAVAVSNSQRNVARPIPAFSFS